MVSQKGTWMVKFDEDSDGWIANQERASGTVRIEFHPCSWLPGYIW